MAGITGLCSSIVKLVRRTACDTSLIEHVKETTIASYAFGRQFVASGAITSASHTSTTSRSLSCRASLTCSVYACVSYRLKVLDAGTAAGRRFVGETVWNGDVVLSAGVAAESVAGYARVAIGRTRSIASQAR